MAGITLAAAAVVAQGAEVFYDYGPTLPGFPASGDWGNAEGWKPEICLALDTVTGKCSAKGYPHQQPVTATEEIDYKVIISAAPGASTTAFALGTLPDLAYVTVIGVDVAGMGLTFQLDGPLGLHAKNKTTGEWTNAELKNDALFEIGGGSGKLYSNGKATLSGGGVFRLVGGQVEAGYLMHNSARIEGFGTLTGLGRFTHQGVIDANVNGLPLVVYSALTNAGQMRAGNGGILRLATHPLSAPGGSFESMSATGGDFVATAGSTIEVLRTIDGGRFRTDETGRTLVKGVNIALRDFRTYGAGTMTIVDGSTIVVHGDNRNDGRIFIDAASKPTTLRTNDSVTFNGTGTLVLGGEKAALVGGFTHEGPKLTNMPTHMIVGAGSINYQGAAGYAPRIVNLGLIKASQPGQALTVTVNRMGRLDNAGLLLATEGGTLVLDAMVHAIGAAATVGAMEGSLVLIDRGSTIRGGALTTAGNGVIRGASGTLDGTLGGVANLGHLLIDGGHLTLSGAVTDSGLMHLAALPGRSASLGVSGPVTLAGTGTLRLQPGADADGQWIRQINGGGLLTHEAGHTIAGTGRIGYGGAVGLINRGLIEAEGSGGLWLYGDAAKGGLTNEGVLRVHAGSTLGLAGALHNLSGQTLAGGSWDVRGTLRLPNGSSIANNAALLVLDGALAQVLAGWSGSSNALSSFAANTSTGVLALAGGHDFASAGDLGNAGVVSIGAGSVLQVGAGGGGSYIQTAGTTMGKGTLQAAQVELLGGTIAPGLSPGLLTIDGDLMLGADAMLHLELGDVAAGAYDRLVVTGSASFAGRLHLDLVDGFDAKVPFSVALLSAAAVQGALQLPAAPPGFAFDFGPQGLGVSYKPTAVPEPASALLLAVGLALMAIGRRPAYRPGPASKALRRPRPGGVANPFQSDHRADAPLRFEGRRRLATAQALAPSGVPRAGRRTPAWSTLDGGRRLGCASQTLPTCSAPPPS